MQPMATYMLCPDFYSMAMNQLLRTSLEDAATPAVLAEINTADFRFTVR